MNEKLKKTVLITGANRGIGHTILEEAVKRGYDIVAHARKPNHVWMEELSDLRKTYGVDIKEIYFDLSDSNEIKKVFATLHKEHVNIDCLINNAGITSYNTPFLMTSMTAVREMFEINLFAMMQITQYCLRTMIRRKSGSIVNMASICGEDVLPSNTIYGSSKAAVISFTKNLASEVGKYGIRVNAIAPGGVDTEMIAPVKDYFEGEYLTTVALGRLAMPEDIANAALFLISEDAKYISGQTLRVDGGKF